MKFEQILEHLDDVELEVRWLQKLWFGYCDYEKDCITLNLASWIVKLLIHEVLHRHRPDWSEERVTEYEDRILHSLTRKQIEYLCSFVLSRLSE